MNIVVITNDTLKEELLAQNGASDSTITYLQDISPVEGSDCYIDLLFQPTEERKNKLKQLQPALIIVNSVVTTAANLPPGFIRISGWPTFLKRTITEASGTTDTINNKVEDLFSSFGKKIEWVADIPGFVTARVISMIINEAYFALDEKVSSKEEIDTAMKLGTNYPYGPFEWSKKIGLQNVYELLSSLSQIDPRYEPSALLKKETFGS